MNDDSDDLTEKLSKEEVEYSYAKDPRVVCGSCRNYIDGEPDELYSGGGCKIVAGAVRAVDTCLRHEMAGSRKAPPAAGSLPGGYSESRKAFHEAYEDEKFPEPVDPWAEGETDAGCSHPNRQVHNAAVEAIEALDKAGWRPLGKSGLKFIHEKLPTHEIEISQRNFFHKIDGVAQHVGGPHQLAAHVKTASRLYRIGEANKTFDQIYRD